MKILLVDDDKFYQELIQEYIDKLNTDEKWILDTSDNLEKISSMLKDNKYDVMLLDLCLRESDGIETVQTVLELLKEKLTSKNKNKNIPIIILTGQEDFSIGEKALLLGIHDFLIKGKTKSKELYRAIKFATYGKDLPNRPFYSKRRRSAV